MEFEKKVSACSDQKLGKNVRELRKLIEKEIYDMIGTVYAQTGVTVSDIDVSHQKPIYGGSIEARAFQVDVTLEF